MKNTSYVLLKMFLDILYSLDSFQNHAHVLIIYLKHYCKIILRNKY